ncbi:MAG: hypothetical protein ABFD91_17290, partial [Anaerohalosphaeraceae bacterium]
MDADGFVNKMAELAVLMEKESYSLTKKPKEILQLDDSIIHLICEYDTSALEIGMVGLGRHKYSFEPPSGKVLVGCIESDILAINPSTGFVELLDHDDPSYVMCICATSGGAFLEALLRLAAFQYPHEDLYGNLPIEKAKENNNAAYACAVECSRAAEVKAEGSIYHTL